MSAIRIDRKSDCCHADIDFDASCYWDVENQCFELGETHDTVTCNECGDECIERVFNVDTGERVKFGPDWREGWLPIDVANTRWNALHEAAVAERDAEQALKAAEKTAELMAEGYAA